MLHPGPHFLRVCLTICGHTSMFEMSCLSIVAVTHCSYMCMPSAVNRGRFVSSRLWHARAAGWVDLSPPVHACIPIATTFWCGPPSIRSVTSFPSITGRTHTPYTFSPFTSRSVASSSKTSPASTFMMRKWRSAASTAPCISGVTPPSSWPFSASTSAW